MKQCILVGGQKGGTGKSTISTNLAVMFKIAGYDTLLIDCDKQQTSLNFTGRRNASQFPPQLLCTKLAGDQLQVTLVDLASKYDVLIIDVGGQDSEELRSAMIAPCVSKMIIPIQAGFFDLETLVTMNQLVQTSKIYNPNLNAACLINRAPSNKQVTVAEEAEEFIRSELPNLDIMKTIVRDRVSYGYAVAKGECVAEYERRTKRDGKATKEMMELFKEITGTDFPFTKIRLLQEQEVATEEEVAHA